MSETKNKPLLIFKCNMVRRNEKYEQLRTDICRQIEDGVVLLPPYISLEAIVGEDCDIKIIKESED